MQIKVQAGRLHIRRLVFVIRNIAYYRSLSRHIEELNQNFWIYSLNNFLDFAVLEWCKIFGSRSEPTHWSTIVENRDQFRADLLDHLEINGDQWHAYWEEIKAYRDEAIAHHADNPTVERYPRLDLALNASFFYYRYLVMELRNGTPEPLQFFPPYLDRYYERLLKHSREIVDAAYASSRHIEDPG